MEPIELTEEQRELVNSELGIMCLGDLAPVAEEAMMGRATPIEVLHLLRAAFKMGWLQGQQAAVEQHNRVLRASYREIVAA